MRLSALVLMFACGLAQAHKPSDSYLTLYLDGAALRGQWDIALRDLEYAIGLDANGDGAITWGELKARLPEVDAYALARLALRADGRPCKLDPTEHLVDEHSDGTYAVLRFEAHCDGTAYRNVELEYSLFFDLDPTHRGLLRIVQGSRSTTGILAPERPRFEARAEGRSAWAQFLDYAREGVWHIWIGFDHILFLISLLLPSVLVGIGKGWRPAGRTSERAERFGERAERFAPAFWDVLKVATSFTLAHSITLSLAALSIIQLPSRLVESAIAFSVVLAALNNVWPVVRGRRWMVAFGFGLIHGFGFASVLTDLGLPRGNLLLALVGFNVGVEAGQLAIIAGFLPLAYALRGTWFYRTLVYAGGSVAIALVAAIWLIERVFDLKLGLI